MGNLFGSSSSSKDYSVNTDNSQNLGSDAKLGTFAEDSTLSNIGANSFVNVLDNDAISSAFKFAESSSENIDFLVGESLSSTEKITKSSFDTFNDINKNSFTAFADVSKSSNNLVADSINGLVDSFKNALNFAGDSQREAFKAISETTQSQSALYGQSLTTVQSGVTSSLTQGNSDIIKIIMYGLVALGAVFALLGKK